MKVLQFTIPVAKEHSIVVQEEKLPHFYNHLHRHNEAQITWIIKGDGTLIAGNYMQPFKTGDIYILGPNQSHILKSDPSYFDKRRKKSVEALTVFFNPDGWFMPLLELPEMKALKRFVLSMSSGYKIPKEYADDVAKAMLKVRDSKNGLRVAAFIELMQLFAGIKALAPLANASTEKEITDTEGLRMNDIYQYTMEHYTENISLKKIASIAHLTPHAFCRYFKKHTRKTYVTFLNEIRVSEACKIMLNGNFENIASVAYDTGFSNAVTFNRVFRKVLRKSPREYLREYTQKVD
ncbi:AraC family transcriptional regulator [Foetidibacter luteolus]|uniref:AraC family transcriptional regulator n=1 Tax=Foetidibacter luteolus TaxID=2608880 RepID=UPI00129A259D|nr:AraC family transcriptional regulator [Foetidibacter luteolus]